MKIIDFHSHFPMKEYSLYSRTPPDEIALAEKQYGFKKGELDRNRTEEEMIKDLRNSEVKAILDFGFSVGVQIDELKVLHDYAMYLHKSYPDEILGTWAMINPETGLKGFRELERGLADGGIFGFEIMGTCDNGEEAIKIIEAIFRLGTAVLIKRGFTIGISDADLPQEAINKINDTLAKARKDVEVLTRGYHDGTLQAFPGRTLKETLELKILELLNKARNETGEVVSDYSHKETHMMIMADSGSRGNLLNLAQMAACVGQQAMRGKRIDKGYNERTLSCFKKGDLGPEAHGFIADGFKKGLNPREFFFASMTGRDSLMDTALRTPKSGYLYRRLANALQDLKVEYDNTVRDSSRKIVQFDYGEDKIDVSKSDGGIINVKNIIKSIK